MWKGYDLKIMNEENSHVEKEKKLMGVRGGHLQHSMLAQHSV